MKKNKLTRLVVPALIIFYFILLSIQCHACTGVRIKTQDGNYIFGRTMEFATDYIAHYLIAVPRNYKYAGQAFSGKQGMSWTTKYAHVGFSPSSQTVVDDGLNEKGLYCGGFFQPGYADYQKVTEKDYSRAISCSDLASWILSTCASVKDVRGQLPKIKVCAAVLPELGYVPPIHYFVADKSGDAIIIEYLDGKLNIYNNKANVITNSPTYIWQTTNVRNFIGLKPENNPAIKINGNEFAQFSQGSGAIGLPGDFSSPSRFIRAAFLADAAFQGKNIDEGIGVIFHIMNNFDIPMGTVRGMEAGKPVVDTTQWTSASDLTNCRYFYNTYSDRAVRMIDLNKLDLDAPDIKYIKNIQGPGTVEDVTSQLK